MTRVSTLPSNLQNPLRTSHNAPPDFSQRADNHSRSSRGLKGLSMLQASNPNARHQQLKRKLSNTDSQEVTQNVRPSKTLRAFEYRQGFTDRLVDSATQMIEAIWHPPGFSPVDADTPCGPSLRLFVQEVLRRSQASYNTLLVALYYLIIIKTRHHIHGRKSTLDSFQCGRRMFLVSLILSWKYLHDRNYSARAWSKISGLDVVEINSLEFMVLKKMGWNVHLPERIYVRWNDVVSRLLSLSSSPPNLPPVSPHSFSGLPSHLLEPEPITWRTIIPLLTPQLDNVDRIFHLVDANRASSARLAAPKGKPAKGPAIPSRVLPVPTCAPTPPLSSSVSQQLSSPESDASSVFSLTGSFTNPSTRATSLSLSQPGTMEPPMPSSVPRCPSQPTALPSLASKPYRAPCLATVVPPVPFPPTLITPISPPENCAFCNPEHPCTHDQRHKSVQLPPIRRLTNTNMPAPRHETSPTPATITAAAQGLCELSTSGITLPPANLHSQNTSHSLVPSDNATSSQSAPSCSSSFSSGSSSSSVSSSSFLASASQPCRAMYDRGTGRSYQRQSRGTARCEDVGASELYVAQGKQQQQQQQQQIPCSSFATTFQNMRLPKMRKAAGYV